MAGARRLTGRPGLTAWIASAIAQKAEMASMTGGWGGSFDKLAEWLAQKD